MMKSIEEKKKQLAKLDALIKYLELRKRIRDSSDPTSQEITRKLLEAKSKLLTQLNSMFDLLSPEQRKKFVQLVPRGTQVFHQEFCKGCDKCYACKGPNASNVGWDKIFPICLCNRCYKYLTSDRSQELFEILAKKKIFPYITYYQGDLAIISFEEKDDKND